MHLTEGCVHKLFTKLSMLSKSLLIVKLLNQDFYATMTSVAFLLFACLLPQLPAEAPGPG